MSFQSLSTLFVCHAIHLRHLGLCFCVFPLIYASMALFINLLHPSSSCFPPPTTATTTTARHSEATLWETIAEPTRPIIYNQVNPILITLSRCTQCGDQMELEYRQPAEVKSGTKSLCVMEWIVTASLTTKHLYRCTYTVTFRFLSFEIMGNI